MRLFKLNCFQAHDVVLSLNRPNRQAKLISVGCSHILTCHRIGFNLNDGDILLILSFESHIHGPRCDCYPHVNRWILVSATPCLRHYDRKNKDVSWKQRVKIDAIFTPHYYYYYYYFTPHYCPGVVCLLNTSTRVAVFVRERVFFGYLTKSMASRLKFYFYHFPILPF